jgi:16S rRNA (adenine1518-N6/adenine1519-N6)-dimethyltransferase
VIGSGVRPLKRLGQHFLRNPSIARRIVESMEIGEGDHILEIGPGDGILTDFLLKHPAGRIVGVEIDPRLSSYLEERFGREPRFELLMEDILKLDLSSIQHGKLFRVVGNIPYSITTPILFRLLDQRERIIDFTVTLQKEVGERIVSSPGCKAYGIPSVFFQTFSSVEHLFSISRKVFTPVPDVDSVVLRFQFHDRPCYEIADVSFFRHVVRTAFGQRRKMLKNTLKSLATKGMALDGGNIDLNRRPEDLTAAEFAELSNVLIRQTSWRSRGRDL